MRAQDTLRHLLGASVRVRGVRVGHVSGVMLDRSQQHVIGFEVTSVDRARRFLPWAVAAADGVVDADSAFLLGDTTNRYPAQGAILHRTPEQLDDLVAAEDGALRRLEPATGIVGAHAE